MRLVTILFVLASIRFITHLPGPDTVHKTAWVLGACDVVLVAYSLFIQGGEH